MSNVDRLGQQGVEFPINNPPIKLSKNQNEESIVYNVARKSMQTMTPASIKVAPDRRGELKNVELARLSPDRSIDSTPQTSSLVNNLNTKSKLIEDVNLISNQNNSTNSVDTLEVASNQNNSTNSIDTLEVASNQNNSTKSLDNEVLKFNQNTSPFELDNPNLVFNQNNEIIEVEEFNLVSNQNTESIDSVRYKLSPDLGFYVDEPKDAKLTNNFNTESDEDTDYKLVKDQNNSIYKVFSEKLVSNQNTSNKSVPSPLKMPKYDIKYGLKNVGNKLIKSAIKGADMALYKRFGDVYDFAKSIIFDKDVFNPISFTTGLLGIKELSVSNLTDKLLSKLLNNDRVNTIVKAQSRVFQVFPNMIFNPTMRSYYYNYPNGLEFPREDKESINKNYGEYVSGRDNSQIARLPPIINSGGGKRTIDSFKLLDNLVIGYMDRKPRSPLWNNGKVIASNKTENLQSESSMINTFNTLVKGRPFTLFDGTKWVITMHKLGSLAPVPPYASKLSRGFQPATEFTLNTSSYESESIDLYGTELSLPSVSKLNMDLSITMLNDMDDEINEYLKAYKINMYGRNQYSISAGLKSRSSILHVPSYRKLVTLVNIFLINPQGEYRRSPSYDNMYNSFASNKNSSINSDEVYLDGEGNYLPVPDSELKRTYRQFKNHSRLRYFVNYYSLLCIPKLDSDTITGNISSREHSSTINFSVVGLCTNYTPDMDLSSITTSDIKDSKVSNQLALRDQGKDGYSILDGLKNLSKGLSEDDKKAIDEKVNKDMSEFRDEQEAKSRADKERAQKEDAARNAKIEKRKEQLIQNS